MQKVKVFQYLHGYSLLDTINIETPLSKVSLEEDGDLVIVPSLIQ
jgi:hypothetical protein